MKQYRQGFREEAVKLSNEVSEERRAGIFHAGHGRDARRGERVLAEPGLFRAFEHEAHTVEPHDVADRQITRKLTHSRLNEA